MIYFYFCSSMGLLNEVLVMSTKADKTGFYECPPNVVARLRFGLPSVMHFARFLLRPDRKLKKGQVRHDQTAEGEVLLVAVAVWLTADDTWDVGCCAVRVL